MKAYFLPLGAGADRSLPAMLAALSCGAAREVPSAAMLRVSGGASAPLADSMIADLNACHRFFEGEDAFAFFRTAWSVSSWRPALPDRAELIRNENSRLLLAALRGENQPLAYRTDPEAVEWGLASLLEQVPGRSAEAFSSEASDSAALAPFVRFLSAVREDLSRGEDVRILLFAELTEGYAAGLALGLVRFLRDAFAGAELSPFLGLIGRVTPLGAAAGEDLERVRSFLSALRDRDLVRSSEERDTRGADAFWLLGLPSALLRSEENGKILDWAAARILGEVFGESRRPSPGLHTREIPGILTLQALDQEARAVAAFARGAFWCLSDLFPALGQYFEHPTLLRSLAPATRNGLFRRFFRDGREPAELALLDRTLRALLLEILALLRGLPAPLREAEAASALWQEAVKACGRAVTLGAELDVARKEAEESGVDKVAPVHRVSMSDTEEEELLRKLDTMAEELSRLIADRDALLERMGGFRARQVLEDCLNRCRVAEVSAREKLSAMPAGEPEERYALGLQERRVRMLSAAVQRCVADLDALCRPGRLDQPGSQGISSPFAGEILDPDLAEKGFRMLTAEGEAAADASRALRDGLGSLLKGYPMNDVKILLKNLLSVCRRVDPASPLRGLMAGVFSVCGVEVSGIRFQSAGELPAVSLLPDMREESRFFTVAAAPERLLAPVPRDRTAEARGLLAFLLLREYRRRSGSESDLVLLPLEPEDSAFCRAFLTSRGVSRASLVCLRAEETLLQPVALLLPELGTEAARLSGSHAGLFPSFVHWLDRDRLVFQDPCPFLSEGDRQILTEQLTRLRSVLRSPRSRTLVDFLSDWHRDIMQAPRSEEEDPFLPGRLRVVCGLYRLPIWKKDLQRLPAFYEIPPAGDAVCAALAGTEAFDPAACKIREEVTYAFRGIPIARESATRLLVSPRLPEEKHLLSSLAAECDILLHSSDDYHEALAAGLQELLDRFPQADLAAREAAGRLLEEAREPIRDAVTELSWPWDTVSASVLTILTECLGPDLASAALRPFSDRLTVFPARGGETIGDALLSRLCVLSREPAQASAPEDIPAAPDAPPAPAVLPDAVLPPLSPDFARALCRSPEGQSLIQEGFLAFTPDPEGIRAVLTLEGAFTLRLIRVYSAEEQLPLYAHDMPSLAVWPSLPFPAEDWKAYFSWAHGPESFRFTVLTREEELTLEGAAPRFALRSESFPLCFLLFRDSLSVGALPNLLPPPSLPSGGGWTASLDFGAAASSLVLSDGVSRWPMHGPVRVRTLLRNPAATEDLLWREFLPAVPVSALLPGALRIFRNDLLDSDLPFRDAVILMSSSLRDVLDVSPRALYTDLKWNGEKGRASRLYLHQLMLMAALEARCGGAVSLCWRAAVPDEMPPEGRERLADLLRSLAEAVREESGLSWPEKAPAVAFASESAALGSYFRFCAPEETRSGFMALDLGADTADLSLFLRGRDHAVRSCQLPLGVHNMLLPALLRRPALLREDFDFLRQALLPPEPESEALPPLLVALGTEASAVSSALRDLESLQSLLEKAARDPASLRQARYGLDALIADHLPLLLHALALRRGEGSPGRTGALLLLHFSFLMMLSGLTLLQISADPQKNDFLPETMTLFLAGRGASLMEALSLPLKTSLWKLLTMFRNPRVASLNLLFSAEKKLEIPVGLSVFGDVSASLPRPAPAPVSMALRPEELLPEFLLRFRREFPGEAALLFPGLYADDYYDPFTPGGRQALAQAMQTSFGERAAGRPYLSLTDCLTHLMELIQEGVPL